MTEGRSLEQLAEWARLLQRCRSGAMIETTATLRETILAVERELTRLAKVEDAAIRLAQMLTRIHHAEHDDDQWYPLMDEFWSSEQVPRNEIIELVPTAFTEEALRAASVKQTTEVSVALINEGLEASQILERVEKELPALEERVERLMHQYGL